jgi:hypothetical protein
LFYYSTNRYLLFFKIGIYAQHEISEANWVCFTLLI